MSIISENISTLIGSIVLAAIFFSGFHWSVIKEKKKGYRRIVSFGAGISLAYVFIQLLPELSHAGHAFIEHTEHLGLPFPQYRVYAAALMGFIFYYSLEYLVNWSELPSPEHSEEEKKETMKFLATVSGFSVYVGLISYLMVRSIEDGHMPVALYSIAMAFHFLSLRHSLSHEYGRLYEQKGKYILGISCLMGWALAVFFPLRVTVVITLLGFISGSVIMNTIIAELPKEKEGRLLYFFLGAVFYTGLLISISH